MVSDQSNNLTNFLSKEKTKISREAPMNIGAEQALLGAIISNNLALEKVENFLEPEHLYNISENKSLYSLHIPFKGPFQLVFLLIGSLG